MGFESGKLGAGIILYLTFVVLPTVGLLMEDKEIDAPIVNRLIVGLIGLFAGHLMLHGLSGNPDPNAARFQRYPGLNLPFLVPGLALLALAWFTNLPTYLSGSLEGSVMVVNQDRIVNLDAMWPRIVTSLFTMAGGYLVFRGFTVMESITERRAKRLQRKERSRSEALAYRSTNSEWED